MKYQKIVNLLDTTTNIDLTRFLTKRWIKIYDQSGRNYSFNKEIRIKRPMLNECIVNDLLLLTNIFNIFYLIFLSLKILLILVMNISAYNNKKFKISDPVWNYKFDLPDASYLISEI